jgi:predicted glycoside hydrolase/deacetylase ChbG (UPF0249 family)
MQARHEPPQHSSSAREICVCVDDFGFSRAINAAALALIGMGRVHAVSAQVGGMAWSEGAEQLRGLDAQTLDVGLHLDLTECPLQPGARLPLKALIARAYARRLPAPLLRGEIQAQLDAFERAMGRMPDYVDGHQHVHQLPVVRSLLAQELARRYPGRMPWLRGTRGPLLAGHAGLGAGAKAWVIAALGARALAALARRSGAGQNARLLGVYGFDADAPEYERRLARWLHAAQTGDLLMCHAGASEETSDPLARARAVEFSVLRAPAFARLVARENIRLRPMRHILQPPVVGGA